MLAQQVRFKHAGVTAVVTIEHSKSITNSRRHNLALARAEFPRLGFPPIRTVLSRGPREASPFHSMGLTRPSPGGSLSNASNVIATRP